MSYDDHGSNQWNQIRRGAEAFAESRRESFKDPNFVPIEREIWGVFCIIAAVPFVVVGAIGYGVFLAGKFAYKCCKKISDKGSKDALNNQQGVKSKWNLLYWFGHDTEAARLRKLGEERANEGKPPSKNATRWYNEGYSARAQQLRDIQEYSKHYSDGEARAKRELDSNHELPDIEALGDYASIAFKKGYVSQWNIHLKEQKRDLINTDGTRKINVLREVVPLALVGAAISAVVFFGTLKVGNSIFPEEPAVDPSNVEPIATGSEPCYLTNITAEKLPISDVQSLDNIEDTSREADIMVESLGRNCPVEIVRKRQSEVRAIISAQAAQSSATSIPARGIGG